MRKSVAVWAVVLFFSFAGSRIRAGSDIDIIYDIFSRGDSMIVWIDLSPFLTPAQVSRLNDGIGLMFQYDYRLAIPKRLWGDVTTAEKQEAVRMSYHVVTKEYVLASSADNWNHERHFPSLAQLSNFLADSINTPLVMLDSLDRERKYTLDLKVTTITLTGLTPAPDIADSAGTSFPLEFLFKKFLSLTGFGRDEFEAKSRPFSKSEILPEQSTSQ